MTLAFRYAARTHVGIVREKNDDSGYAGPNLLMVADGMGGVAGGDIASAITVDVVRTLDHPGHTDPAGEIEEAAADANARIAWRGRTEPRYEGMGTTLTAGILHEGNKLKLAHIGDSRAYLVRGDEMVLLTKDHTFVQRLVDEGRITEAQARVHPHRALIIRVLDGNPENRPDFHDDIQLEAGDRLLFCSDGVEDVGEEQMLQTLRQNADPGKAGEVLISLALRGGSSDNVTCVVADVVPAEQGLRDPEAVGSSRNVDLDAENEADATAMQPPVDAPEPEDPVLGQERPPPEQAISGALAAGDPPPGNALVPLDDPEELRYAPRPPSRFRWPIRIGAVVILLGVLVGGCYLAYDWTQQQYYVGTTGEEGDERVAIYRGIDQEVPLVDLSSVVQTSRVGVQGLPTFDRNRVREHIPTDDLSQARSIVSELERTAEKCAGQRGQGGKREQGGQSGQGEQGGATNAEAGSSEDCAGASAGSES